MASYGGASIFGTSLSMATAQTPREAQINAFFGVNGLECLDGGARGRVTFARGLLVGNSALELNLAENLFRSYHDGQGRILVDNIGNTWPDVRMLAFNLRPAFRSIFAVALLTAFCLSQASQTAAQESPPKAAASFSPASTHRARAAST